MKALLAFLAKVAVDWLARVVSDWRRDADLKAAGAAEADAKASKAEAEAERRAAAVKRRSDDETIDTLDKGAF